MYVFDPVISAGSGGESTLHLRDEPVLSLIEAVGARRSRFNQQESAEQSFLEFKGSIPARDAPTHGSSTRQCQPHHATNSGAERLNGHSCQRDTAISPRIQFSPACPISSEESATYSPALVTHAFRRSDSRPEDSGDVQPLASYHKIEAFAATTSEVAGLLSGFDVNLSPRPPGVIERTQGSRQIEDPTSIFSFLRTKSTKNATHGEGVLGKGKLVASFMEGFRTMYDRGFVSTTANPETASSSAVSEPERNASEPSSTTSYPQKEKRPRVDQSDHDADSDEDKNRKRSRTPKKDVPPGKNDCQKFACPYRKHNPRKYNVQSWRTCALTPHENVARVKAHLYRSHLIYLCPRCRQVFPSQEEIISHQMALEACAVAKEIPVEGVTQVMVARLKSRRKAYPGETEAAKWHSIYKILFPGENMPSPYFEPVQEDVLLSSKSTELANYEEYARRELPKLVRARVEEILRTEMQPIEAELTERLLKSIKDCQDKIFASYRDASVGAQGGSNKKASNPVPSQHNDYPNELAKPTISNSTGIGELFQPIPPLTSPLSLNLSSLSSDHHSSYTDSAYMSEVTTKSKRRGSQEPMQGSRSSVSGTEKNSGTALRNGSEKAIESRPTEIE